MKNFAKAYQLGFREPQNPEVKEQNNSAQIVINDALGKWLADPHTKDLINVLHFTRTRLLEECVEGVGNIEQVTAKLHKAKQIKEIIKYVTRS